MECQEARDKTKRMPSLLSRARERVLHARDTARARSEAREKRPRASPLLEINGQFMEIGWMYGN